MNLYISIDTYQHHPRNFFGFKKSAASIIPRPVTLSILSDRGDIFTAYYKGARLKDDNTWDGVVINPADYGHKKSEKNILQDLCHWFNKFDRKDLPPDVYVSAMDYRHLEPYIAGILMDFAAVTSISIASLCEISTLEKMPTSYFMRGSETGMFEALINPDPTTGELTTDQKISVFHSHRRYPHLKPSDLSLQRAHKMLLQHQLVEHIKMDSGVE